MSLLPNEPVPPVTSIFYLKMLSLLLVYKLLYNLN